MNYKNGFTSIILRVKIMDSTSTTGGAKTGLTSASSGLIISTIADNEATATAYTVAGGTIESITTLGTFAAPTATKCRFKEVDATNHPGLYEIQIADARWAVSNARSVIISVSGATGAAQVDAEVQLEPVPANTRQWLDGTIPAVNTTGVPKVDLVLWLGVAPLALSSQQVQGVVPNTQKVDVDTIKTNPVINAGTVTFPANATLASTTNITGGTITTATNLTNLPSIPANWLTAAGIAAGALNGKGDWLLSSGYTVPPTVAQIRTEIDTNSADLDTIIALIAALNNLSSAQAQTAAAAALAAYDGPTNAEMLAAFSALNNLSAAQVNAEVVDALNVDTYAQPGQGTPAATTSICLMLRYLFKSWRNKSTQDATDYKLFNDDATTVDQRATCSDDGTTFSRSEVTTGP